MCFTHASGSSVTSIRSRSRSAIFPSPATEVLSLYAYDTVFRNFDLSNGAVLAVILLLISLAFTFFYVRLLPKDN